MKSAIKYNNEKDIELCSSIDNFLSCYPVDELERSFRDMFASHLKTAVGYDGEALASMFYGFTNIIDILREREPKD